MTRRTFSTYVVATGGLAYALFIALSVTELAQFVTAGVGDDLWRALAYALAFGFLVASSIGFWSGRHAEKQTAHELGVRTSAERETQTRHDERRRAVAAMLEPGGMHMVFQPIVAIATGQVHGYEALARFPELGPDHWFAEASQVGLLTELELHAIGLGLAEGLASATPDQYISVNVSAETLLNPALLELVERLGPGAGPRVIIELTEHTPVVEYDDVIAVLAMLRARGVRLAIDDLGTGYGSLTHVVRLSADLVKIDRSLISGIADDTTLRSLVAAMVAFTATMRISLLAEGVETEDEATCLRGLGVGLAQGWFFGRPGALPAVPGVPGVPATSSKNTSP